MVREKNCVSEILHTNYQYIRNTRRFLTWMPLNIIFLSVIICDIWKNQRVSMVIVILEHVFAVILSLNVLYLSSKWFLVYYFPKKYPVSVQRYNLLQDLNKKTVNGNCNMNVILEQNEPASSEQNKKFSFENFRAPISPLFTNTSPSVTSEIISDSLRTEKLPIKHYHVSPTSFFASSPIISDTATDTSSFNSSVNNFSGVSRTSDNFTNSPIVANSSKSFGCKYTLSGEDFVDEVDSVRKYEGSRTNLSDNNIHWKNLDNNSFYRNQNIQRSFNVILNDVYQLSSITSQEYVKPVNEISSLGANLTVCKKFGTNQSFLPEWIANLRMWITQTILTRIIKEIKYVNNALSLQGITNVSIGSSGLERLKKTATMSQVYQNIPSLSSLISFLDISANQEYVVQRISALSTGSMSNYCWNSGGTYESKPWNESLPTDAALVMHLVAAYFDSQLYPLPHTSPDGKQFSSAHYVKPPAVPVKNKKSLIIYQQTSNPPHFQLIIGEDTYDISRGRNNLFHVLLFFLHHIKTKESGMFEHVNLGSSGINMLWIINDPTHNYKNFL